MTIFISWHNWVENRYQSSWISHVWLASYDPIIFQKCLNSKWHNFHMEWPKWMIFLWANPISHVLSCCIIKIHQKWSRQNVIFQVTSFEFLVWTCEFEIYKAYAHETTSNTSQMPNEICSNWFLLSHCLIWERSFWRFH